MGYYNEFPHTRNYDADLGFLIKAYKELLQNYKDINEYIKNINDNIVKIAQDVIMQALEDGKIKLKTRYIPETETLEFIFISARSEEK